MITVIILAIIAWWISEGSNLINDLKLALFVFDIAYKKDKDGTKRELGKLPLIECAKCLGFWIGLIYYLRAETFLSSIVYAILVSSLSILISKIFWRIR